MRDQFHRKKPRAGGLWLIMLRITRQEIYD